MQVEIPRGPDELEVSLAVLDDDAWKILTDSAVTCKVHANATAADYAAFLHPLTGESFPYTLASDVLPLPVFKYRGVRYVLTVPVIAPAVIPGGLHHTDAYLTSGEGSVVWS